jgi:hypothetical protein
MGNVTVPVVAGTLPAGFCPPDYQTLLNGFSANQTVVLPGTNVGVVVSPTKPLDTTVEWTQLDTLGRPVRNYNFAQGAWLSLHPLAPGMTLIWTGSLPDFTTFDGGDANALSPISGPMWQTVLAATFPVGAGTLPSGTVLTSGATGGEEKHVLTINELAPHTHDVKLTHGNSYTGEPNVLTVGNGSADPQPFTAPQAALSTGGDPSTGIGSPPIPQTALPHNCLPPYTVVYFLQRTNRIFYAVQ